MYIYIYTHIHTHTYIYVYTYTHTHTIYNMREQTQVPSARHKNDSLFTMDQRHIYINIHTHTLIMCKELANGNNDSSISIHTTRLLTVLQIIAEKAHLVQAIQ